MGMGNWRPQCGHNSMGTGTEFEDYEGQIERHHQFPQSSGLKQEFEKEGINIEDYTLDLPQDKHRLRKDGEPYGLHTGTNSWNKQWKDFFEKNQNANLEDKEEFLKKLQSSFDLEPFVTRCWRA